MILGIDTAANQCAVALVDGERVWRRAEAMARGHAEALFPMIDAVLAESGTTIQHITRIGVCTGPGSFTGVRIGVAAARGLSLGLSVPAIGVTRFEALRTSGDHSVSVPGRGGEIIIQDFGPDGRPSGAPRIETGESAERTIDPARLAQLAAGKASDLRPAPVYLRPADAAPSRERPPVMLD